MNDTARITNRLLAVLAEEGFPIAALAWCGDNRQHNDMSRGSGVDADSMEEALVLASGVVKTSGHLLHQTCLDASGGDPSRAAAAVKVTLDSWTSIDAASTVTEHRP